MKASVTFVRPERTLAVSVTGRNCELGCPHCGGRYLRSMITPDEAIMATADREDIWTSALVSGGCDRRLQVLSRLHVPLLGRLGGEGFRINAHAGLLGEDDARALAPVVDVFSVDYIADRSVARAVYGVDPGSGYQDTVRVLLSLGATVVPHVCIGLDADADTDLEHRAMEELQDLGCDRVVMLVFIPTPGTPSAARRPPSHARVQGALRAAVKAFGDRVTLGCMRPGGRYRTELDVMALNCGVRTIVRPAPSAVAAAGDTAEWREECCALC